MFTKRQAETEFRADHLTRIPTNDRPALRMAWNDYVDALQKSGRITERQAETWDQPSWVR